MKWRWKSKIWRNSDDDKKLKRWWKVEMMMKIWRNIAAAAAAADDDDDDKNMKCLMGKICRAGRELSAAREKKAGKLIQAKPSSNQYFLLCWSYGSTSPGREKWSKCGSFSIFFFTLLWPTVLFVQLFSTVLKRFCHFVPCPTKKQCPGDFSFMWVPKLLLSLVKIRTFCPETTKFGQKLAFLCIFGQTLPAHLVPCWWVGWWLWRAGCISQDTYLLYSI